MTTVWRRLGITSLVLWALVLVCGSCIAYLYFYPHDVIIMKSLTILDKEVKAGSYYKYEFCHDKRLPVEGMVIKKLINSTVINYPVKPVNAGLGEACDTLWEWMPEYAEADSDYQLILTVTYHPTVLSTKTYTIMSPKFGVAKKPCKVKDKGNQELNVGVRQ